MTRSEFIQDIKLATAYATLTKTQICDRFNSFAIIRHSRAATNLNPDPAIISDISRDSVASILTNINYLTSQPCRRHLGLFQVCRTDMFMTVKTLKLS
ncbi:MAG: hypothetical protein PUP93_12365 [Rhizonema sp. NSF051]|nr:hypothetical protein [Rhizonema sp. NSF051]